MLKGIIFYIKYKEFGCMNCVECEKRKICNECKSLELDNLDEGIKFSCYKFKPIMTDNDLEEMESERE